MMTAPESDHGRRTRADLRHQPLFYLVLGLFFLSGFSALLYQVVWQRMLGCFAGVDVYSVTITVAAFMAGLGCGSLAGGHIADRVSLGTRILVFCVAEAAIAVFALLSKWLYYDLLYLRWSGLGNSPVLLPAILFVTLLLPTFCMGITLPVLSKSFVDRIESAAPVVGYLYGINTLGAAVGAFSTVWILFRRFGFEQILQLGALLNAVAALGALLVWARLRHRAATAPNDTPTVADSAEPARFSMAVWLLIYALSGFIALGLEIVWFRFFGVLQKSTAFTFGNLLGIFLVGLAIGIIAGVPLARRTKQPARAFLFVQAAVSLYAVASLALFVSRLDRSGLLAPLWAYLQTYEPISPTDLGASRRLFAALYFIVPAVLIAPATVLMGVSFPLLQRAVQLSPASIGRRVGWLQTMNIAGSMLGAMLVGWGSLRWFGTAGTLHMLAVCGGAFAILLAVQTARSTGHRLSALAIAIVLILGVAIAIPRQATLWAKLHGATPGEIILKENDTGLSVLKGALNKTWEQTWVYSNGLGQSWLPFGSVHTQLGLLGAVAHPSPNSVAVIGLASGDTLYAAGGNPNTKELTCIELVRPQHDTLTALAKRKAYPPLRSLLADTRVQWLFTDGRAYLQRSGRTFDVIEADALRPNSAYSGNLYSHEYFRMIKSRLNPGGLAISWVPTDRTLASFLHVFPYAVVVSGIAIGSEAPIDVSTGTVAERLAHPFTSDYYAKVGEVRSLLAALFSRQYDVYLPDTPRPANIALNSDLFPRDEFGVTDR
jgi:predicted membrane-bound spermidine synthase